MKGWIALAFVLVAAASTLGAAIQAINEVPAPGTHSGADATILAEVLPGGPAWHMGARVGDRILAIDPGPTEESWVMETDHGTISKSGMVVVIRETIPLAVVALALAVLSMLLLPLRPPVAAAAAAIGVALTERTLMATGDLAWSTAGAVAAMVLPGLWVVVFGPWRPWLRALIGVLTAAVTCFWLWARFVDDSLFDVADFLRILLTYGLVIGIIVTVIGGAIREAQGGYDVRRLSDVLLVSVVVAILTIGVLTAMPLEALIFLVAVPLLAYPVLRGRLRQSLERLVLGDLRSRASIEAVERERARMSREIHDDPLQRLAALTQRLDQKGDLDAEAETLRSISDQLRGMSVELHPLILADLGLRAALVDLSDRLGQGGDIPIAVDLDAPSHAVPPPRAPDDVELAVYRVIQEALGNAIRHSGATQIALQGQVAPDRIELVVRDDGVGIDEVARHEAAARGRVGLHSMAERAELVGARLRIEPAMPGTQVTLTWPA